MIRRRPLAVYRVIDEEELLSGELLPADGVELSPEWSARLAPAARIVCLGDLRRLAPLALALVVAVAALGLVAARWAGSAAARTPNAPHTAARRVALSESLWIAPAAAARAIDAGRFGEGAGARADLRGTRFASSRVAAGSRRTLRSVARGDVAGRPRLRRDRARRPVSRARRLAAGSPSSPALTPAARSAATVPAPTPGTTTAPASPATEFGFER